jgi:prefoldin beta subunit
MTSEETIAQLQVVQQNLQHIVLQKQQVQRSVAEVESALKELKTTKKSYKIIGNIMVEAGKEELEKDLQEKKELFSLRMKTLDAQEEALRKKTEKLQKEIAGKGK